MRFDEIELVKEPEPQSPEPYPSAILPGVLPPPVRLHRLKVEEVASAPKIKPASRFHRSLAFLTDLSLFFALALALTPLLPYRGTWRDTMALEWPTVSALGCFLFLLSYYYFVASWLIWGKTVGGAIFDVRIVPSDEVTTARNLTRRWLGMLLSIALGGLGFLLALLPRGRSLADRLSNTHTIAA